MKRKENYRFHRHTGISMSKLAKAGKQAEV